MLRPLDQYADIQRTFLLGRNLPPLNNDPSRGTEISLNNNSVPKKLGDLLAMADQQTTMLFGRNSYSPKDKVVENISDIGPARPKRGEYQEYLDKAANNKTAEVLGDLFTNGTFFANVTPNGVSLDNSSFDFKSSILSRVLNFDDTTLGRIGANRLAVELGNRVAVNAQKKTFARVNIGLNEFVKNYLGTSDSFLDFKDYEITNGDTPFNRIGNAVGDILGVESPYKSIGFDLFETAKDSECIWSYWTNSNERNKRLLEATGAGQKSLFLRNISRNEKYMPEHVIDLLQPDLNNNEQGMVARRYIIYTTGFDPTLPRQASGKDDYGRKLFGIRDDYEQAIFDFDATMKPHLSGGTLTDEDRFFWDSRSDNPFDKRSILYKTQELYNKDSACRSLFKINKALNDGETLSHGNRVKKNDKFCRSFSIKNAYTSVDKLIRHRGLDRNGEKSVLQSNGFVRIVPDVDTDLKKLMFSIENLAWMDSIGSDLFDHIKCEMGPFGGRVMWFPPYDIKFTENTNASWDSVMFVGRPEPVYVYNNSERSGTLNFKIIVDHPSIVNLFARPGSTVSDKDIAAYFAGCDDRKQDLSVEVLAPQDKKPLPPKEVEISQEKDPRIVNFNVYFPNDQDNYKTDVIDTKFEFSGVTGLNAGLDLKRLDLIAALKQVKTDNDTSDTTVKKIQFDVSGYASYYYAGPNPDEYNYKLSFRRAKNFVNDIIQQVTGKAVDIAPTNNGAEATKTFSKKVEGTEFELVMHWYGRSKTDQTTNSPSDTDPATIKARRVEVKPLVIATPKPPKEQKEKTEENDATTKKFGLNRFGHYSPAKENNCGWEYFEKLQNTSRFVYDSLKEKIRYFHPAFHSTTPEGFNTRITFLHQCMRQGPTINKDSPDNMSFGRPPVCVLHIGDFYHTKIIIDNFNLDFEPLVWDLNPEGVGVQPMIANVSLSFKFIGGSSMDGPINALQNALGFNYYANTELFDPEERYFKKMHDGFVQKTIRGGTDR